MLVRAYHSRALSPTWARIAHVPTTTCIFPQIRHSTTLTERILSSILTNTYHQAPYRSLKSSTEQSSELTVQQSVTSEQHSQVDLAAVIESLLANAQHASTSEHTVQVFKAYRIQPRSKKDALTEKSKHLKWYVNCSLRGDSKQSRVYYSWARNTFLYLVHTNNIHLIDSKACVSLIRACRLHVRDPQAMARHAEQYPKYTEHTMDVHINNELLSVYALLSRGKRLVNQLLENASCT